MERLINLKNVAYEYSYGDNEKLMALYDIDLSISIGEFVAVVGHNGSGKSTLAKLMNAILLPTSGSVLVDGLNTNDQTLLFEIRQRVGMIFQNPDNQIVATTVEEDVAFGPENLGLPSLEIRRRVDEALSMVDMTGFEKMAPHNLSGGQKQRVAIAGVVAMRPKCIVMDEATAMLDPIGRTEVQRTIQRLKSEGISVVLITHFMNEAVLADRVVVMDDGRIVMNDVPREVFSDVERLKKIGLDVPQVTELALRLKEKGLLIDNRCPLTINEVLDAITPILKK